MWGRGGRLIMPPGIRSYTISALRVTAVVVYLIMLIVMDAGHWEGWEMWIGRGWAIVGAEGLRRN